MLTPGTAGVKGGCERIMWLMDGMNVGDKAQDKEMVHSCNVCEKAFKSFPTTNLAAH